MDLTNPDTWAAMERQAYEGTVDLKPLPPPAYKYFAELTAVYYVFRFENLPHDEAQRRKALLLKEYQRNVADLHRARDVFAEYQENVKKTELLCTEIEKANDIREIALTACKIIGLLTGDGSFYERQRRKIEEAIS